MDEIVPDNSDFISSGLISTSNQDIDFIGLSSVADPLQSNGHVIRVIAREEGLGVNAPYLLAYLSQGQSFDIAVLNITQGTLTTSFTEYNYTLTNAQADSITDYSTLELRLEASCNSGTCSAGSSRDSVSVSWMELAILTNPPVPPATLDSVSVNNSTSLQINFTEPIDTSQVLSYNIERDDGSGFSVISNIAQGVTTFDDNGLIADSFYSYRIVSIGTSSNSIPSNVISQRTTVILFTSLPDSNISVRWLQGLGTGDCSDLTTYGCLNENIRNDNDFVQSIGLGNLDTDIDSFTMSDITDPLKDDGHFLKYTLRTANVGTNQPSFDIQLRQGTTEIASFNHPQGSITSNYQFFQQELTAIQAQSITDYTDLEITITASCPLNCSNNPSSLEKLNVSWIVFEIQQVQAPSIAKVDTLSSTSLRIIWLNEDVDPEITNIIIQRINGTDFITIGNVTSSVFSFDETGLLEQQILTYRLTGMLPSGFTLSSKEFTGSTPPSTSTLNTQGVIIEPDANNSFTVLDKDTFTQTVEHYNLSPATVQLIITDIDVNGLNAYEIIVKMNDGSYDLSQEMSNVGAFYGNKYLIFSDIDNFIGNVTNDVILSLGGSNGTGDNPLHGQQSQGSGS